jgi:hypothetical protein
MPLRSVPNTIEALRLTLLRLEQTTNSAQDSAHLAELKRILLHRIASLEAVEAIESTTAATPPPADSAAAATTPADAPDPDLKLAS